MPVEAGQAPPEVGQAPTAYPSDAPRRQRGTRTRSGNAMDRTRSAILAAALQCVAAQGVRKTTMGDVAAAAGIAKATLYNHFRTKPDLLAALVDEQVALLATACTALADEATAGGGGGAIDTALIHAAGVLAGSQAVRRVAEQEPALLLPLLVPGPGRAWFQARAGVGDVLVAAGLPAVPEAVDTVLRWVVGQLVWPVEPALIASSAALVGAGVGVGVGAATAGSAGEFQLLDPEPGQAEPDETDRTDTR